MVEALDLWMWRHPRAVGTEGRCIGRTDVDIDARRAKRLAHRIAAMARRSTLPRQVWTSPAKRCAAVGRLLKQHGFLHRIDPRLWELDFGTWDGRRWDAIEPAQVAHWEANFTHHAPGGGESLAALRLRAQDFLAERARAAEASEPAGILIVAHAGWINAVRTLGCETTAAQWPRAIGYGAMLRHRWAPTSLTPSTLLSQPPPA